MLRVRYIIFSLLMALSFRSIAQNSTIDSAHWQVSAGSNFLFDVGNRPISNLSKPGVLLDFAYQGYLGKRDSVNEHSIFEIGLRYNYFHGNVSTDNEATWNPYSSTHVAAVVGFGGRLFSRDCSEGFILGGITAGVDLDDEEVRFIPTAYLKGGFFYFSKNKKQSHGPYLMLSLQDVFFLNDYVYDEYWAEIGVSLCYSFRF